MYRILVTGGSGFVGARIMQQLAATHKLVRFPREALYAARQETIQRIVDDVAPQYIIHTAAISDTKYSQAHPEESYKANVLLPVCMAKAARAVGAKLIGFSSDQVYKGQKELGPFDETLSLHPTNVYGQHKLEAEQRVLEILPEAVMLRATWMYDLPGYDLPIRGNFLVNLIKNAIAEKSLMFSPEDYRGITYVRQVVQLLVPAFSLPGGVYNFGSENPLNMYETACWFNDVLGLGLFIRQDMEKGMQSLRMNCEKLRKNGIEFDDTKNGICRCVADYGLNCL